MKDSPQLSSEAALRDALFLCLVVVLSFILYVGGLGFYSDDWAFTGRFQNTPDQSFFGLVTALFPETAARPMQTLYLSALYRLFGPAPLGYHLTNSALFGLTVLLFYFVLRELGVSRLLTLSVPLVFALLPHYSTDRFWVAAFQANLSVGLYFLSLYSDLKATQPSTVYKWSWKAVSAITLLGSVLAYELVAPLFLLNFLIVWQRERSISRSDASQKLQYGGRFSIVRLSTNPIALTLAIGYKALVSDRAGMSSNYVWYITHSAKEAIVVNYGSYGLGLPVKVIRILSDYPDIMIFATSGLLGLLIFGYLYRTIRHSNIELLSAMNWLTVLGMGVIVFGLGYATVLTTDQIAFSTTGIHNRTAIAAALGVAISFVAAIGLVSVLLPIGSFRHGLFCLLITLLCTGGFLINNTIAAFWIAASREQQSIITALRQQLPILPPHSTVLLNGVCPYIGPGIVFETHWDVGGMLRTYYHDATLKGDVLKHNSTVSESGISTIIYDEDERKDYPYSRTLILYNAEQKTSHALVDFKSARRYLQRIDSDDDRACLRGKEGYGSRIF